MSMSFFRRALQSLQLARMGWRISAAETKRAAKLKAAAPSSTGVGVSSGSGGGGPSSSQQLSASQLQDRIRALRAELVQGEAEANAEHARNMHRQRDENLANHAAAAADTQAAAAALSAKQAAADKLAQEQLDAFTARIEALAAANQQAYMHNFAEKSLHSIRAAESFGIRSSSEPTDNSGSGGSSETGASSSSSDATNSSSA